jgi:hypothetical protein
MGNAQTKTTTSTKTTSTKPVKRTYVEKMIRKYEHNESKRVHDLQRKVERMTKNWTLEIIEV